MNNNNQFSMSSNILSVKINDIPSRRGVRRKLIRKLLSCLLTVALIFSIAPLTAYACQPRPNPSFNYQISITVGQERTFTPDEIAAHEQGCVNTLLFTANFYISNQNVVEATRPDNDTFKIKGLEIGESEVEIYMSCDGDVSPVTVYVTVPGPPEFTTHPVNQSITAGQDASFTVAASGAPAPTYQWQEYTGSAWVDISDGGLYSGADTDALTLTSVPLSMDDYQYRCLASNTEQSNVVSNEATLTVTPIGTVDTPTADPLSGEVAAGTTVTLSCATVGATIYYTTDGSEPTNSSTLYTIPIPVNSSMTIKARAYKADMTESGVMTTSYTITPASTVTTPTASPAGGTYSSAQTVTLSTITAGATIYYTLDGSDPVTSGTAHTYSAPITVQTGTTLKAYATATGMIDSAVMEETYASSASGSTGGGSSSTTTQKTAPIGGVDVNYTINGSGTVTLKPTTAQLEKLLAAIGSDGVLNIAVSGIDGMKAAIIEIDLTRLTASDKLQIFSFSALDMELRFPAGALESMKKLATTLRFGLKPGSLIFELTDANGKDVNWYDYENPVTISMAYTLPQDISTRQIVMVRGDGGIVPRSWYSGGRIYAKIHKPGTYDAAVKSLGGFTDTAGLWMDEAVGCMAARGIVEGVGNNQFDRSGTITRAHFVTMLMRAQAVTDVATTREIPVADYDDVPDWAKEYVIIAKALGITLVDEDGNFNPNEAITRQEMFYMAYEAMGACGMLPETFTEQWISFSDWDGNVKAEYSNAIQNLAKLGLVNGNGDGTLNPNGTSTRAEGAQFLYNILKYDAK